MYRLEITPDFEKDFKSLEKDVANRVTKKLEWLAQNPETLRFPLKHAPTDLKGLQKYRIGDLHIENRGLCLFFFIPERIKSSFS